ncbi:hypothetical protein NECAME_03595 [Necator americanus]|uniref:Amino acid permease/ SLC12A domain-containing protein n=1 Tax=Necator americanus TaxID=51031 RepID=W2T392_NECAM|nr:hypothetical protein NECAME_03595 [Necator americanus]ETN76029.1 hypothetical protein NECAME_03595 [Necator americanus]
MLRKLSVYTATEPTSEEADEKPKQATKMGTIMGVFFPCIQNIFGVLFFIRMTWIVGTAGIVQSFFVVLTCVSVVPRAHQNKAGINVQCSPLACVNLIENKAHSVEHSMHFLQDMSFKNL